MRQETKNKIANRLTLTAFTALMLHFAIGCGRERSGSVESNNCVNQQQVIQHCYQSLYRNYGGQQFPNQNGCHQYRETYFDETRIGL